MPGDSAKVIAGRTFEIVLPDGQRITVNTKSGSQGGRKAGSWAVEIARLAGLPIGRNSWRLRGPLGVIPARALVRELDLKAGECLHLERNQ